jgi:hypothetical protein
MPKRKPLSAHAEQIRALLLANDPATYQMWGEYELAGSLADRMEEIVYNHGYAIGATLSMGEVEEARVVRYQIEAQFWELAQHEGLVKLLEEAWAHGLEAGAETR